MKKQKRWRKLKTGSTKLEKSAVYESIILYCTLKKQNLLLKEK